jgi:iron(III) transport system permease protein
MAKQRKLSLLILILYSLLVLSAILVLAASSFKALLNGNADLVLLALPLGRRFGLLVHTILFAMLVSLISLLIGSICAIKLWTWSSKKALWILILFFSFIVIPPYIHALSWMALINNINNWLNPLGLSISSLSGWHGSILVQVSALTPLALICAWFGYRMIDPELIEIGRSIRADFQSMIRIAVPLAKPALITGGGIIFLLCLLDYSVPSLFGFHVYAMEIFSEFSASQSPERTFFITLPVIVISMIMVILLLEPVRSLTLRSSLNRNTWKSPPRWPRWFNCLIEITFSLLILIIFVPLISLLFSGGELDGLISSVKAADAEIKFSIWTTIITIILCLPIALLVAWSLLIWGDSGRFWWIVVLSPLFFPASLVGVGLIYIINNSLLDLPQVQFISPALASFVRFVPIAVLVFVAGLKRQDALLHEAALVFNNSRWSRILNITLPLLSPVLLIGTMLIFSLSLGELGATLMLLPPGRSTITIRLYNFLHYGASEAIVGLSLLLVVIILLIGLVIIMAIYLWSRLNSAQDFQL